VVIGFKLDCDGLIKSRHLFLDGHIEGIIILWSFPKIQKRVGRILFEVKQ
jgi:hypothetical protein